VPDARNWCTLDREPDALPLGGIAGGIGEGSNYIRLPEKEARTKRRVLDHFAVTRNGSSLYKRKDLRGRARERKEVEEGGGGVVCPKTVHPDCIRLRFLRSGGVGGGKKGKSLVESDPGRASAAILGRQRLLRSAIAKPQPYRQGRGVRGKTEGKRYTAGARAK